VLQSQVLQSKDSAVGDPVELPIRQRLNLSGRHPKGRAVLVQPYEPELDRAKRESNLIIPQQVGEKTVLLENRARVIEVGPMAWDDEKEPRARPGDLVLVTKFAGFITLGMDNVLYRLVNDRDIFCVLDEES